MAFDLSRLAATPQMQEDVLQYLREGMPALIDAINQLDQLQREVNVEPDKPQEGMLRYADGTDWNPGDGAGLYRFTSGSWVKQITAADLPDLSGYAPLASPTFTGDPKAPTPAAGDNDTSIATSAFVRAIFAIPPAIGSTTPAAGAFTTIAGTVLTLSAEATAINQLGAGLIPKAWLHYDQTGTPAILDDENIDSVTDEATGNFTPVLDRDMSGADAWVASHLAGNGAQALSTFHVTAPTVSGARFVSFRIGVGDTDCADNSLIFFGRQA